MKKIILFTCFACFTIGIFGQHGSKEKIKTFKIAYITEKLDLTSKEAQQFWPVYNTHQETVEKLRRQERKLIKSIKEANDKQAEAILSSFLEIEEQKSQSKKKLITDLKKVLSYKKILKLIKAEADFHKRMLARIREQRRRH
jgi:hypothetical protein